MRCCLNYVTVSFGLAYIHEWLRYNHCNTPQTIYSVPASKWSLKQSQEDLIKYDKFWETLPPQLYIQYTITRIMHTLCTQTFMCNPPSPGLLVYF